MARTRHSRSLSEPYSGAVDEMNRTIEIIFPELFSSLCDFTVAIPLFNSVANEFPACREYNQS
jgi:hypothetical protein